MNGRKGRQPCLASLLRSWPVVVALATAGVRSVAIDGGSAAPRGDAAKHLLVRREATEDTPSSSLRLDPRSYVAGELSYIARLDPAKDDEVEVMVGSAGHGPLRTFTRASSPTILLESLATSSSIGSLATGTLALSDDRHTVVAAVLSVLLGSMITGVFLWAQSLGSTRSSQEAPEHRQGSPERLAVLDNAKFWLITVVIVVHWECCFTGVRLPWHEIILRPLNPWCTRCFAFVSGAVSPAPSSGRSFIGMTFRILAPFVLFNAVLAPLILFPLTEWQVPDFKSLPYACIVTCFYADNVSWYLIALVQWKIWSCFLQPFRPTVQIVFSMGLAACGGYAGIAALRFDWAVASFPLFVAGQCFPLATVVERAPHNSSIVAVGFALLSSLCYLQSCDVAREFMEAMPVFGWSSEEHFGLGGDWMKNSAYSFFWIRGVFRNMLELTKVLTFLLLCCPRNDGIFSSLGRHTMYPYLLHYSALTLCERVWSKVVLPNHNNGFAVATMLAALGWLIGLNACLSSPPIRWLFRPFIEPFWLRDVLGAGTADALQKAPRPWPDACSRRQASATARAERITGTTH